MKFNEWNQPWFERAKYSEYRPKRLVALCQLLAIKDALIFFFTLGRYEGNLYSLGLDYLIQYRVKEEKR